MTDRVPTKARGLSVAPKELNDAQDRYDLAHYASWKPYLMGAATLNPVNPAAGTYVLPMHSGGHWMDGFRANMLLDMTFLLNRTDDMPLGGAGRTAWLRILANIWANDFAAGSRITSLGLYPVSALTGTPAFTYGAVVTGSLISPGALVASEHRRIETAAFSCPASGNYAVQGVLAAPVADATLELRVEIQHRQV